jgi:sigma-E factor negative regulatory protein RseA
MMDSTTPSGTSRNERISALVDGQLTGANFAATLAQLDGDDGGDCLATWHCYQLIGDTLRSPELAESQADGAFLARLRSRLADEPQRPASVLSAVSAAPPAAAANVPWRGLAIAASVAAVCAVSWGLLASGLLDTGADNRLAQSAEIANVVAAADSSATMIRDARLDQLLAAHKQLGGTSALQMPAGFLRNATFDSDSAGLGR